MRVSRPHFDPRIKPRMGARLNTSDPINQNLVARWLMNEGAGLVVRDVSGSGVVGTMASGFVWGSSPNGTALIGPASSTTGITLSSSARWSTAAGTFYALLATTNASRDQSVFGTSSGLQLYYRGSVGRWYAFTDYGGAYVYLPMVANRMMSVVFQWPSKRLYLNGALVSDDTDDAPNSIGTVYLMSAADEKTWAGPCSQMAVWTREISPAEIQRLYLDPGAGLKRDPIELWTAASGGAPAFKPYWAANRNVLIA